MMKRVVMWPPKFVGTSKACLSLELREMMFMQIRRAGGPKLLYLACDLNFLF